MKWLTVLIVLAAAGIGVVTWPDIQRYLKMRRM